LLFQDDFEDIRIRIPQNDELTSSSDDSEFEFFNYKDHRKTLTSLAQAVRLEFLQSMPAQNKHRKPTTLLQTLNTYMTLSKSWQSDTDSKPRNGHSSQSSHSSKNSHSSKSAAETSRVKFHWPIGEKEDVVQAMNMSNPYEIVDEHEPIETLKDDKLMKTSAVSFSSPHSKTAAFQHETQVHTSKILEETSSAKHELVVTLSASEPPKNALVLYWGRISMTAKELRNKNLTRCIKALLEEDHYEFVLLKIQERKFLLQYCNTSKSDMSEEKVAKNKRKKSLTETIRFSGRDFFKRREDNAQLLQNRRGSKSNFLACIGLAGSSSRNHSALAHKDSLCLQSYQLLKRKKLLEFDYKNVVYCGVEERNIPNNMLVWIYHAEYGNYSAVDCHCVECDDQSHARQLSRALKREIAKANSF